MSTEQETTTNAAAAADKAEASSPAQAAADKAQASSPGQAAADKPQASSPTPATKAARPKKQPGSGKAGAVLATLALLLALAALGGSGYLWYLQQQSQQPVVADDSEPWRTDLEQLAGQLESRLGVLQSELGAARQQLQDSKLELGNDIEQLSRDGVALLGQMSELGRTDRDDWQLAEVEYLLRMAHQRVVMGGELKSAASLLANADNILQGLNMAGLHQVRKQVARDLAAVRAAVELDSEGIYLRLEALQQQSASLPFFGMPEIEESAQQTMEAPENSDWQSTLRHSWQLAVAKFKALVVVQKRDDAVEPLLSEAWQSLVRERLALDLEQAKNAVVLQQETIFAQALSNARALVQSHYLVEHRATRSVLDELAALEAEKIVSELPDISGSQEAIRDYIDQKYQSREQSAPLAEQEVSS